MGLSLHGIDVSPCLKSGKAQSIFFHCQVPHCLFQKVFSSSAGVIRYSEYFRVVGIELEKRVVSQYSRGRNEVYTHMHKLA